jgi:hypothetical protein
MSKQIPKQLVMFKRAPLLALLGLLLCVSIFGSLLMPAKRTAAATSSTLNFQARLLTASGALVPDGNYNVEFKLFNALTSSGSSQGSCTGDANCLWTETRTSTNQVRVTNGYLTVNLGSVTGFSGSINWDQQMWLSMNIGGTGGSPTWDGEMSPRLQLTAVPYAFRAGMLAAQNGSNLATLDFTTPTAPRTIHLPDEGGTLCIQSSTACGFALTSGSGSYIQNTTGPAQSANFNISGTGALAVLDSTGTTLSIGPSATSGITLQQNTTLASGKSLTLQGNVTQTNGAVSLTANAASSFTTTTGSLTLEGAGGVAINALSTNNITLTTNSSSSGVVVKSATNSTTALQVLNSSNGAVLTVDTAGTRAIVGSTSLCTGGRFCVGNSDTGTGGSTVTNSANFLQMNTTGVDTGIGQKINLNDISSGSVANVIQGLYVDSTGTTNTAANVTSILAKTNSANPGNLIQLTSGSTDTLTVSNTGAATFKNQTNSTSAFQIQNASGEALFGVDTTSNSANLVSNPSFEVDTNGWNARTGCTKSRATSPTLFGGGALKCTNAGTAGAGVNYPTGALTATTYILSFYAKAAGTFSTFAYGYSPDGSDETTNLRTAQTVNSTGWTRYTISFTGSTNAAGYLFFKQTDATGHDFYIDGVQLEAGSTATAYQDGKLSLNGAISSSLILQGGDNSTTAFAVYTASGSQAFNVNTLTNRVGIGSLNASARLHVAGSTSNLPVQIVQAASGQSVDIFQVQDSGGNVLSSFSSGGQLVAGRTGASGLQGSIFFADGSSTNTASIQVAGTLSGNVIYQLPVASAGTYAICTTATVCSGYAPSSGSTNYIRNQTTTQSANINVQAATSGTVAATFQANASGSADILDLLNGSGTPIATFGNTGNVLLQASANANNVVQVENALGYQAFNIDTSTNNLITNSSFEQGTTTGWTAKGSPTPSLGITSSLHVDGGNAMTIGTNTSNTNGAKYNFTLVSGTAYTFSVSVRASTGFTGIELGYSMNGSTDTACTLTTDAAVFSTGWRRFVCTFTPASSSGTTYVYLRQTDATSKTLYVDAAQLEASSSATAYRYSDKVSIGGSLLVGGNQAQAAASSWALQVNTLPGGNGLLINGSTDNNILENALLVAHPDGTNLLTVNEVLHSTLITGGISGLGSAALQASTIDTAATAAKFGGYLGGGQTGDILKVVDNFTNNTNLFSVGATGNTTIHTTTNSTTAFQLQNSAGASFFTVDNINANITLDGGNSGQVSAWQTNSSNPLPVAMGGPSVVAKNGYVYDIPGDDGVYDGRPYYAKINANGTIGAWTKSAAPGMSGPVVNQMSVTVNGYLYVLGGFNAAVKKTVQYASMNSDGSLGTWSSTATMPKEVDLGMAFAANGYIYVVGGFQGTGGAVGRDVYYAKVNADGTISTWNSLTNSLPVGANRQSSGVVYSNGYVYIFGGDNGTTSSSNTYYAAVNADGTLGTWNSGTALPATLTGSSAVVVNGYAYVMGGNTVNTSADTTHNVNTVYYAPLAANGSLGSWTQSTNTMPAALETQGSFTANGYIYALGGYATGRTNSAGVYYTSTGRIMANASLDLVGSTNNSMADGGDQSTSSSGGSLTAGNTNIVGALQVQNNASFAEDVNIGGNLSVAGGLTVGPVTGDTVGQILVLGNKTNTGDPTGTAGAMYYNAAMARFRCYQAGAWYNCTGFDSDNNRKYPSFSNDFLNGSGNQSPVAFPPWIMSAFGNSGCTTAPTTTAQVGTASHPGFVQFDSGVTGCSNPQGWKLNTDIAAAPAQILLIGGESFEAVFQIVTTTNTTVRMGFHDSNNGTEATDGVYINIAGTTLSGKVATNPSTKVVTGTTFTISGSTWYRAKIVVNSDLSGASYALYNDSGTVLWSDTLTTTVPSTAGHETGSGVTVQTSNSTLTHLFNMDYMSMWWTQAIGR